MGEIVRFKKPSLQEKSSGKTLCKSGFHKWRVIKEKRFDVRQGKLVTVERCERCGETRARLT